MQKSTLHRSYQSNSQSVYKQLTLIITFTCVFLTEFVIDSMDFTVAVVQVEQTNW